MRKGCPLPGIQLRRTPQHRRPVRLRHPMPVTPGHPRGHGIHPRLDRDHVPRRIQRRRRHPPGRIARLPGQPDQLRRGHDLPIHRLKLPGALGIAVHHPRHVPVVEHALLGSDQRQHLLRRTADQRRIALRLVDGQRRPRHVHTLPRHLRRMHPHVRRRRELDPSRRMRPVIDPQVMLGARQVPVRHVRPGLAQITHLLVRGRQPEPGQFPVLPLEHRLPAQSARRHHAGRHQQVRMVISRIGLAVRRMDGQIHRHPVTVGQVLRQFRGQRQPLLRIKLVRQRHLDLARHPRILALFGRLGRVPQGRPILRPGRRE